MQRFFFFQKKRNQLLFVGAPSPNRPPSYFGPTLFGGQCRKFTFFPKGSFSTPSKITSLTSFKFATKQQLEGNPQATKHVAGFIHIQVPCPLPGIEEGAQNLLPSNGTLLFALLVGSIGLATAIMTNARIVPVHKYEAHPRYIYIDTISTRSKEVGIMPSHASRMS